MNRLVALPIVLGALTFSNAALANYGSAGCGLGSLIIKDDNMLQLFAGTTNGTFASQTFGITFGTSNCTTGGIVRADKEQEAFAEANLDALRRDMARGQGEHLVALASLLECEDEVRSDLYAFTQDRYESVFPSEDTTALQALYMLKIQLSQDPTFVKECGRI